MSEHNEEYTADDPRLTAFALGELEGDEVQAMEAFLAKSPEARAAVEEIRACTGMLELEFAEEGGAQLSSAQRAAIDAKLEPRVLVPRKGSRVLRVGAWVATAAAVGAFVWVFLPEAMREKSEPFLYAIWGYEDDGGDVEMASRIESPPSELMDALEELGYTGGEPGIVNSTIPPEDIYVGFSGADPGIGVIDLNGSGGNARPSLTDSEMAELPSLGYAGNDLGAYLNEGEDGDLRDRVARLYEGPSDSVPVVYPPGEVRPVINVMADGNILIKRENYYDPENSDDYKKLREYLLVKAKAMEQAPTAENEAVRDELIRSNCGTPFEYIQKVMEVDGLETIRLWKLQLAAGQPPIDDELSRAQLQSSINAMERVLEDVIRAEPQPPEPANNERYVSIIDNPFVPVRDDSLSTFSIDVDTASYANTRRYLLASGTLPPPDAVRIEELINYFPYDYPSPDASQPFSVNVEVAAAPWKPEHRLVKIGLKGREPVYSERKNANLVFLIDVSGSMNEPTKLPLLVESLSMLVTNLDSTDRVAIVVYAGSSGLVLDSTSCSQKPLIISALERLSAGGSTNGGQGIRLAYAVAQQNFVDGGINRVVLATDGDFNVGTTSLDALDELITEKAKDGVFLSVLGFGRANFNDSMMEMLADKGNGNYSYIDSKIEGHKVLVEQLGGTLVAIAKDVKIQIEFNPAEVQAFRLIGYENRVLAHKDFNDDTKDAGEIGSGHTVTALYEVVPHGVEFDFDGVDALRYQAAAEGEKVPTEAANSGELLTLKLRYKQPEGSVSRKIVYAVHDAGNGLKKASEDFRFAASVASFGMLLRGSKYKGAANWNDTLRLAQEGQGADIGGYRLEFTYLVQRDNAESKTGGGMLLSMSSKPAVCLVSGGMDSAVVLAEAHALGFAPHALSFRYGQRHLCELDAAARVAEAGNATEHRVVAVDLAALGGSALTDEIDVPKGRDESSIGEGVPATYVPARNTVFLSIALGWAEVLGATDIFCGVNAVDYSGYPDCRPEFLRAFEALAAVATAAGAERGDEFRVHAPLLELGKKEIVLRAAELEVDLGLTLTCYDPVQRDGAVLSCGACDACVLRLRGFEQAGCADPICYV